MERLEANSLDAKNVNAVLTAGDDDEEGEEEDEESSSSSHLNLEDQLSQFRQEWQAELKGSKSQRRRRCSSERSDEALTPIEEKAKFLFMKGVSAEKYGRMFEAIKYYRQAVQIVPDIEQRIENFDLEDESDSENEFDDDDEVYHQLTSQLNALSIDDISCVCEKQFPQQSTHISALPIELIHYILRFVVSTNLDLRSLEIVSQVCRGFYVCARDPEIWRLSCVKIFGRTAALTQEFPTWREMYLNRPHALFHGVYICKYSYIRQGDHTMNPFYADWLLVEYFRYIRLFPDGYILMITSVDDIQSVVSRLRFRNCSMQALLVGHYRIVGNVLTAVLQYQRKYEYESQKPKYNRNRHLNPQHEKDDTFHVVFELGGSARHPNTRLTWQEYSIHTRYKLNNRLVVSEFDIKKLNPMVFSRVKSYTKFVQGAL